MVDQAIQGPANNRTVVERRLSITEPLAGYESLEQGKLDVNSQPIQYNPNNGKHQLALEQIKRSISRSTPSEPTSIPAAAGTSCSG